MWKINAPAAGGGSRPCREGSLDPSDHLALQFHGTGVRSSMTADAGNENSRRSDVALSTREWNYLGALRLKTAKNPPTLVADLGGQSVLDELVHTGHLKPKEGRFVRTEDSKRAFAL